MNILVSNDDGVFAAGIRALANTLAAADHTVTVVCPDRERSATGHGLTMHKPLRADPIDAVFHPAVKAWACSGTPADCVKLALGALVEAPPDMVISGINHGPNLGTDVLYSGTVSAAMEGTIEGIPSMAVSLASFSRGTFLPAAQLIAALIMQLNQKPIAEGLLLNINVPAIPSDQIKGIQITRQGIRRYFDLFEKRVDPRGKTYFWLAGEATAEIEDPIASQGWPETLKESLQSIPTDVQAIQHQFISITPLQYNLTSITGLTHLHQMELPVWQLLDARQTGECLENL